MTKKTINTISAADQGPTIPLQLSRKHISKRARFEVFKRDGFVCQYCGSHPPDALLEIDHIIPLCEDGNSERENLITSCMNCNRGKAGILLSAIPKSLKRIEAETIEKEKQINGYREVADAKIKRVEKDAWDIAEILIPECIKDGIKRDWLRSIKNFNERIPFDEMADAADLARSRKPYSDKQRFLYFCGICWNKIQRGGL